MKSTMSRMVLTVLATCALAACGGGGGSTPAANNTTPPPGAPTAATPTPAIASALVAIQAQLSAFQAQFATTMPLANNTVLLGMLDATFMHDGDNGATFVAQLVTVPNNIPIGFTFGAPIGVTSFDSQAAPNDASHQWFASELIIRGLRGHYITMLAIKNATTGQWLLAGNQRVTGIYAQSSARQFIYAPPPVTVPPTPVTPNSISTGMSLGLQTNQLGVPNGGVSSATVSGPGVMGATPNVLGAASLLGVPVVGVPWLQNCAPATAANPATGQIAIPAINKNCVDITKVVPGTYSFNIIGKNPATAAAFNVTYKEKVNFVHAQNLTAANFPVINAATPRAGLTSGATVTVNWTVPAAQTASDIFMFGTDATTFAQLFSLTVAASGAAGATLNNTAVLPLFPVASVVGQYSIYASSVDANGLLYTTSKDY
jgi:hypothetical protein